VAANYKITSLDDLKNLKGKLSIDSFVSEVRGVAKAGKFAKLSEVIKIPQKIVNDFHARGWNEDLIRNTVKNPHATRIAANKAIPGNSVTIFYRVDGSYVAVDDITQEVIQITDNAKVLSGTWFPDSSIINPYKP